MPLGHEAVDAAVEAPDMGVELVDEAPEQALALDGELEAGGTYALCDDAERFAHRFERVDFVPDLARVEPVALPCRAEELPCSQSVAVKDWFWMSMQLMSYMTVSFARE